MQTHAFKYKLIPPLIIALTALALYANSLYNGFVYDDTVQIVENPWVTSFAHIGDVFTNDVWGFTSLDVSKYYRPFMYLIYMTIHAFFGLNPLGYHLAMILLHAAVSVSLYALMLELTGRESKTEALTAALIFAAHPIHTEAVSWVGCLPDVALTLIAIMALLANIKDKPILCAALFLSALMFKESAIVIPILVIAYDIAFRRNIKDKFELRWILPFIAALGLYFMIRIYALGGLVETAKRHAELSTWQYIINVFPLFTDYLHALILPINLNAYRILHPALSITEPKVLISIAIAAAYIIVLYLLRKHRTASFGMLLLIIPLLPVFYIQGVADNTMAERYLYLPSTGFAILITLALDKIAGLNAKARYAITAALVIILALYSIGTIKRNRVWKDDITLWEDTVRKSPDGDVPHSELAYSYHQAERLEDAIKQYNASLFLNLQNLNAHAGLAEIYLKLQRPDDAIKHLNFAIALEPRGENLYRNLAKAYEMKGWTSMANKTLQQADKIINSK